MYAHNASSRHIPQPPHSAGLRYKGLRAAIDPQQMPSPVEVIEADKESWENSTYMTLPGSHVPLSTTDFTTIDQGNSSPRYLRVSTWTIPSSSKLANECEIPLSAIVHPFADQDPREEPVPVVEMKEGSTAGPARCGKCRGYINAWCTWVNNGVRWKCNLCEHETEVDPDDYCQLDATLLRTDHAERPELNKGTVDFVVPETYWALHPPPTVKPLFQPVIPEPVTGHRKPQPLNYVIILDVSMDAFRGGFTSAACRSILNVLYGGPSLTAPESHLEPCFPPNSRLCIITFDKTLHFYNLNSNLERAQMLVVPDMEDVFVPSQDDLFVDPQESRHLMEPLLTSIMQRDDRTAMSDAGLGSALVAGLAALVSGLEGVEQAGRGGKVIAFATSSPNIGIGALQPRDETELYDTEKEMSLFKPRDETWQDIGVQCADEGVGVSLFLSPFKPMDVGTIGVVSTTTGGELFLHPRFDPARDSPALDSQLRRLISRKTVYNAVMRIRTSYAGLRVQNHLGNYSSTSSGDLQFGTIDADKALTVVLEHTHTLDERKHAYLQCAVLYTTADGHRRVRTCNVALQVGGLAGSVFRFADMDTVVSHMVRDAISRLPSYKLSHIKDDLTERCAAILLGYRRNCAASTAPSQLIIPEAFRALPVYTLAIHKCKALRGGRVTADVRNYWSHKLMSMPARTIMQTLYPPLLALHDLHETIAVPNPVTGEIDFPALMRDSHLFMEGHGVYLVDNEDLMMIWIGASVSPQLLNDLFGVEDINNVDRNMTYLPHLPTLLSTQVRNILSHRALQRGGRVPKFAVCRQNMDGSEIDFSDMLVEDENNAAMSYLDYLCVVHKQISVALTGGGNLNTSSSFRGTPW
ncbi:sec24-like protein [Cristinia sonorae]|uniref:Sec24-like protein n=1 Tax=Cristinia sonorae TaxID=1940300 RepID=A0A8K0XKS1_9AGAR|nr:sec24-like protein [Cristinia sonorae]